MASRSRACRSPAPSRFLNLGYVSRARAVRPTRRHCASPCLQQSAPVDEPPEHEEHAESLQDREEEEKRPDAADRRASNEYGVEQDLQGEERPQFADRRVRGSVEREPSEAPPEDEGRDAQQLEDEPDEQGPTHAEPDRHRADPERAVRLVVRGGRRRVERSEEEGDRPDVPPRCGLDRPHQGPAAQGTEDAESDHVRDEVHPRDALPVDARDRIRERQEDHEDGEEEEPLRPDDRRERADGLAGTVPNEGPGNVRGDDDGHRGKSEGGQEERVPLHEALADQLLDDLDVFLSRVYAVRRLHVEVDVEEERERPEQGADDDDPEYDPKVIDEEMARRRGLSEHPADVQRHHGDNPELDAANAHNELREVARGEVELLRGPDFRGGSHVPPYVPRKENPACGSSFRERFEQDDASHEDVERVHVPAEGEHDEPSHERKGAARG